MKYLNFKEKVQNLPFFSSSQLNVLGEDEQNLRNQLSRWTKKGLVLKLRKGLYILNKGERRITPSRLLLANQIYSPSYVSMEYALAFHNLIPEQVSDITSVTTRKTAHFQNNFGLFTYQHIPERTFKGFRAEKGENGFSFFIASPEKSVVDFLYLNLSSFNQEPEIFSLSYRFQNLSDLKRNEILKFAQDFQKKKLLKIAQSFCDFAERER